MSLSLPGRILADELMDTEKVSEEDFARCLQDLELINIASMGYRPTLNWMERAIGRRKRLTIVDVGSGRGDMLRKIRWWADKRGLEVELFGIDLNPLSNIAALAATPDDHEITYITGDAFSWRENKHVDLVISSLFAHHLSDEELVRFFAWMEGRAALGWFINDLHRHWLPYHGLKTAFNLLPVHRFVRHDGPVSVRRAFVASDFRAIAGAAGIDQESLEIKWCFPFRWGVGRVKTAG